MPKQEGKFMKKTETLRRNDLEMLEARVNQLNKKQWKVSAVGKNKVSKFQEWETM